MHQIQKLAARSIELVAQGKTLTDALSVQLASCTDLTPQERAAIQDIGYGVMRHWAELRAVVRLLLSRPLPEPLLEHLLVVALYQLWYTRGADHAVVNEAVSLAGQIARGRFKGLVNAVLRNALRRHVLLRQAAEQQDESHYNHPQWWLDGLRAAYPAQWQDIVAVNNMHPPMTLRLNLRRTNLTDYLARLHAAGIVAESLDPQAILLDKPCSVHALPGFAEGLVSVQDWGAQQAALRLDLADGMRVLDACAAPGGKTCHMLERADLAMTALDVDAGRLARVQENLDRLGLSARLCAGDAGKPGTWWDGLPFDRILADVPCSASGVVRRHPDIRWLRRPDDAAVLANQQSIILDQLWGLLASGGKMLYATCSIQPEENAGQLAAFLARQGAAVCLNEEQLLPTERHDGFYYALLTKP